MESFPDQLPFSSSLNLEQSPFLGSLPLLEYLPFSSSQSNFNLDPQHFYVAKVPKQEPFESDQWINQLPDLHSIEEDQQLPSNHLPTAKRFRSTSSFTSPPPPDNLLPYRSSSSRKWKISAAREAARKRRKRISEKTRCLAKLLPSWEKKVKMDTATMLSEAYKYIRFLQAQVSVLQSMPYHSLLFHPLPNANVSLNGRFDGLEKLNRQQLLQVVVNSPVAQMMLSSQESCIYSFEQVLMLKNGLSDFFPNQGHHHP